MQPNAPIGIVGLGLMGTALSERLIDAGVPWVGFDIEASRCEKLKAAGGMVATSVHELASRSRKIVVAVYSGEEVEALFDGLESGAGPARPIVICTTTCTPDEIIRLAERARRAEEAARHGLVLPITTAQAGLLRAAIALEGPDGDSAAVIEAIRQSPAATEVIR
jgi:NAD binding domain of 6-phosphogluconate dehydrogenase